MISSYNKVATKIALSIHQSYRRDPNISFPLIMWLSSRLVITIAMLFIAPLLPAPPNGIAAQFSWDVFHAWDSGWYEQIANIGYQYSDNKELYSVAFFPLFPLTARALMTFGCTFQVAGTLVNNLAFLAALIVLYGWMNEQHGVSAARWTTAVLAWCPLSLFGTVIYTEGLYLFLSTAALRAFDKQQYGRTAFWGALATATRPTGVALLLAFVLVVVLERKGMKALIASLATGGGLVLFSLYCQIKFGDALAFFHAQKAWRPTMGIDWMSWLKMLVQIILGPTNWKSGYIKDPLYPLLFFIIIIIGYLLSRRKQQLNATQISCGFAFLGLVLWLLAGDRLTNAVMIFGGAYLLWLLRAQLSSITVVYGLCAIALLLVSGSTVSLNRLAYGIVAVSVALGVLLSHHPRWGYSFICLFSIPLISFSIRFAQNLWIA